MTSSIPSNTTISAQRLAALCDDRLITPVSLCPPDAAAVRRFMAEEAAELAALLTGSTLPPKLSLIHISEPTRPY